MLGGFKNGMLGGFKNGMFVVYIKWYVGGLHKKVLISGLGINFWPQPAVGFYVNHQHTILCKPQTYHSM